MTFRTPHRPLDRLCFPRLLLALALAGSLGGCDDSLAPDPAAVDILERLNQLPGVTAREIPSSFGFGRAFELDIEQPLDHLGQAGATFTQRAYLTHTGESDLMVFAPSGYGTGPSSSQELGIALRTNTLNVTHRFFIDAEPYPLDWQYLDIRQSAADHHRVVTLFKEIYSGKWISSGASKSGETVLFHRRYYPGDVDASVVYVAPLLLSTEDPRCVPFLESIGTVDEQSAIRGFQRRLLQSRDSLLGRYEEWFGDQGLTLSLPIGPTFESSVMSYEWAFWQYTLRTVSDIPDVDASYDEMLENLAVVSRIDRSSDGGRYYFRPYFYQAFTEIGYPARDFSYLADLLAYEPLSVHERYGFPPELDLVYRPQVIPDVLQWVQTQGNNIVLIYGGADPWTCGAIELTGQTNALKITQPGANHRVRIADLAERDVVLDSLSSWLDMELILRIAWPAPDATYESEDAEDLLAILPPRGD